MSYYAYGDGYISFGKELVESERSVIEGILGMAFEYVEFNSNTEAYISDSSSYYEEEVDNALLEVSNIAPIVKGEIEYRGEDGCHWRFYYLDGYWVEQEGCVVYKNDGYILRKDGK